ncbi:MAG: type II toxin-antitoxin system HicB family antitoxin [Methylocystis sp.]|nr:type II toxin-antitoxin system HicB family antitoxin [Methylocystis sp.]MBI3275241.1 type II toxin-antitoxin system HicB family antitoxin [Methylocystis sp.]
MRPYIVIVHKEGESAYGMSFPDAPGCFSAADEIDELFAMANEALEGWTEAMIEEGLPIPPTRDLSEIKADPKWAESFEDAVLVIALAPPFADKAQHAA